MVEVVVVVVLTQHFALHCIAMHLCMHMCCALLSWAHCDQLLAYAGEAQRTSDIYGTKSVLNKLGSQITREFKGVENVYTQHKPLLKTTLEQLLKGACVALWFVLCSSVPD